MHCYRDSDFFLLIFAGCRTPSRIVKRIDKAPISSRTIRYQYFLKIFLGLQPIAALDMAAFSNSHYESVNFVRYFSPMIHIVNPEAPWSTAFMLMTFFFIVLLFTLITFRNVQERSWCQNHVIYVGCHIGRTFAYNLHVSCRTAPSGIVWCSASRHCPVLRTVWTSLYRASLQRQRRRDSEYH